ncbi:putative lysine 2,3-aminomutase [Actinacidiphila reveromycinica]|uniref:Putative lysine 2,3-aminomutase n=1 Tax=Actinacidiphila reveromycinica TaxID=659352 RepID=A0A7U3VSK2_9ACTN|nr:radical SAM protein [Streptomyces sp. SN-593]BBB01894.1 putative lysine 2,3-aminomutase [Streptomyces sp. SN-593]
MPLTDKEAAARPAGWEDWTWQQRHAVRTAGALKEYFPQCPPGVLRDIDAHASTRRFQVTPYYLSLIRTDGDRRRPRDDDPLWRQVCPSATGPTTATATATATDPYGYDGESENWELDGEMVTPIAQHKYDNRIIVRYSNVCHAYCQFCYEALRTLERNSAKPSFERRHWRQTLDYLADHAEVEEVILSGGEPFLHSDDQLAGVLADLREVRPELVIRVHTRSLTFNPFRITERLAGTLRAHRVQALGLHVTHPHEITPEFVGALRRLQGAVPLVFSNVPLLRGVNACPETLRELSMALYRLGVHAGYLYHFMPHSPMAELFWVPVDEGRSLVRSLKRRVSNPAVPEYVLPHPTGKYTVPLLDADEHPRHEADPDGTRVLGFVNWRGERVTYPDPEPGPAPRPGPGPESPAMPARPTDPPQQEPTHVRNRP